MSIKRLNLLLVVTAVVLLAVSTCLHYQLSLRKIHYWWTGATTVAGNIMYVNPDDQIITRALVNCGIWEPLETAVLHDQLHEGDTFIDVGANIGYYTIMASKLVGPSGRVIAFEPDPTNFAILKRNVEVNHCTNVTLEQKALSNKPGTLKLYLDETNKGGHKIFELGGQHPSVEVEAVTLDDYLKHDTGRIDLVKIDTEGAEGVILEGMQNTLRRQTNARLLVEFYPVLLHSFGYDPAKLLEGLKLQGYEFRDVNERRRQITATTAEKLLAQHTTKKHSYTNLLLQRPSQTPAAEKLTSYQSTPRP